MHKQVHRANVCVSVCVYMKECATPYTHGPHVRTWKQQIAIDVHIICISNIVQHTPHALLSGVRLVFNANYMVRSFVRCVPIM